MNEPVLSPGKPSRVSADEYQLSIIMVLELESPKTYGKGLNSYVGWRQLFFGERLYLSGDVVLPAY